MLEDIKTKILHSLPIQMDTIQLKMKREEVERPLEFFSLDVEMNMKIISALWILWRSMEFLLTNIPLTIEHF
jgi:hypothetical protein